MTAVAFAMIAFHLLGMLVTINLVGRPREPLTPGIAVAVLVTSLLMIVGIYWLWQT